MKHKMYWNLAIAFGIALLLVGGLVVVSQAQSSGPQDGQSPQSAVGTAFTYQGRLLQNGSPYSGTCDFRFTLYDDNSLSPSQVGSPVEKSAVQVQDGYFSTLLDFGDSAFTGEGRQLGIEVRCPSGSGSYTPLSDYVWLSAAPYALSLRPGAVVSGSVMAGATLLVNNTYDGMFASYGIQGTSQDVGVLGKGNRVGVEGEATGSGVTYGVYGSNSSTANGSYGGYFTGYGGVYGKGTGGAGVRGASTSEAGGYFTSTNNVGVFGRSESSWGVYGYAASDSGKVYGVYGRSDSTAGYGVYGYNSNSSGGYGVYGESSRGFGVYGKATPPDGYGLFSEGNTMISGTLYWKPFTSSISLPGSAFSPLTSTYSYHYEGVGNAVVPGDSTSSVFVAPVQLPNHATVTGMAFYWKDGCADDGRADLYRTDLIGGEDLMAQAFSHGGGPGQTVTGSSSDYSIDYAYVDNSAHAYYAYLYLPRDTNGPVIAYGVVISYTVGQPY